MKGKNDKCPKFAKYQYAWAGKIMRACEDHMKAMLLIAKYTGNPLYPEKIGAVVSIPCEHMNDLEDTAE